MKPQKLKLITALVALACSVPVHAVLERVGPVSNATNIGGYPAWYEDTTGLAMEFCAPQNQAEVTGGWCRLLPPDVPVVPEVFPTNFFGEHFYWGASASVAHGTGLRGIMTLAVESSFANGAVVPGDQIAFARIRMVFTPIPMTGRYRIIHPYGEDFVDAVAGDRIFFTNDVLVPCPTGFDCPLQSRVGPFLLPSATPGGAEMPPVSALNPTPDTNPANFGGAFIPTTYPGTGSLYIADPARTGPVTGSPLPNFIDSTGASRNHNILRLEGPVGSNLGGPGIDFLETTNFSLTGRVYTGAMPAIVSPQRASYGRSATGTQLDVLATAVEAAQGRIPAQPRPLGSPALLSFFNAPCTGTVDPVTGAILPPFAAPVGATESQMFSTAGRYFGQVHPVVIPTGVCIKDASARDAAGNIVPSYTPATVTDEVAISQSLFDPTAQTLTVAASSSDTLLPPLLSLTYPGFRGDLVGGSLTVPVTTPPESIRVVSSALGSNHAQVTAARAPGAIAAPATAPVVMPDSFTFLANAGPQILTPLANDTNVAGGTVTITSAPRLGTAVVNVGGTVTYTPTNPCLGGTDGFTYTVTVGAVVSNTGTVTLNITGPGTCLPVAAPDTAAGLINVPVSINVLANDTDPNGFALTAPANVTAPLPAGATATVAGSMVSFLATAPGTYIFNYQAMDSAGLLSAPAKVTVNVVAAETSIIAKSNYSVSKGLLIAAGTVTPAAGQTVSVEFINATGTVLGSVGTALVDALGNWSLKALMALPAGATALRVTTSNGTVTTATIILV